MSAEHEAIEAALRFFEANSESTVYGHFHGGDPRDFSPGGEDSTDEEKAKWETACKAWNDAEAAGKTLDGEPGPHRELRDPKTGGVIGHVTLSGFGLGVNVYRDPEVIGLADKMRAALKGEAFVTKKDKERAERDRKRSAKKRERRKSAEAVVEAARAMFGATKPGDGRDERMERLDSALSALSAAETLSEEDFA